jgi:hypothetical protein
VVQDVAFADLIEAGYEGYRRETVEDGVDEWKGAELSASDIGRRVKVNEPANESACCRGD